MTDSRKKPPIISITEKAKYHIKELLDQKEKDYLGIRVGISTKGCSGLSYDIEYVNQINKYDEVVNLEVSNNEDSGSLKVFIDPKAVMYLIGSEMDFVEEKFKSGFVFVNPNEKGRCGCGKSFKV